MAVVAIANTMLGLEHPNTADVVDDLPEELTLGPCCTSQMPWELKGSCLVCCREATAGIPQTRRSTQLHVHIATKTFTTGVLLQKGSKQTACQCKQNLDTHRKHILDMAVATSEGLSVQLRGSVITRSFQSHAYQYRHADMALMPSCQNSLKF